MTKKLDESPTVADVAAQGGHARARALTPEKRADIARRAAETRWNAAGKSILRATHDGDLEMGSIRIPCAVLEDGTRVVTQAGVFRAIGRTGKSSGTVGEYGVFRLPVFLQAKNLKAFITPELIASSASIRFKPANGGKFAYGYDATIVPLTCQIFLEALAAGVLNNRQAHIAEQCRIIGKGFAVVGITALIDEATGYQEVRDRQALQKILDAYLRKELAAWAKRFPDDFYLQIFRLRGWQWKGMKINRPGIVANYTKDFVYARLAPGVLQELERVNPIDDNGRRPSKHHQWLTSDVGHPRLQEHLTGVIAIMRGSTEWEQARRMIQRAYPKVNTNLDLPFPEPYRCADATAGASE